MLTYKALLTASACSKRGLIGCSHCGLYDTEEHCIEEIAKAAIALADMLKRLEYNGDGGTCPMCGYIIGHTSDCELAALLKGLEGEK